MTVSRAYKRGNRAGGMRPVSRNRRVEWNANLKAATNHAVPAPERKWTPIRPRERQEIAPETPSAANDYETETIVVTNIIGVQETQEVTVNRRATVIDGWLHDDEKFFARRHIRVIEHARDLWRAASMHAATPIDVGVFGTRGLEIAHDDELAARALNLLRRARSLVPRWQWNIFENVVRWNEPYGFAGSRLFGDKPKKTEWTKLVVRDAAETISKSLFL